jgi:hypothetical protein
MKYSQKHRKSNTIEQSSHTTPSNKSFPKFIDVAKGGNPMFKFGQIESISMISKEKKLKGIYGNASP